jgi:hypothetical protein
MKNLCYQDLRPMNPSAQTYKPNHKQSYLIRTDQLTKYEENIFQEVIREWTDTPTLNLLLEKWSNYRDKTLSMLNINDNISIVLLNVSSLNRYLIDIFSLIDSYSPPIIILNGTHHDDNSIKQFTSHFFNYNVFSIEGSNAFGGVLVAVHKSIRSQRVLKFDNIPNLIALEIGSTLDMFQLVTCYSPPLEPIPFDVFDRLLQLNANTIFTGDFNAKHSSWSRSIDNQKGRTLFNWLSSSQTHSNLEIVNKLIPTSTRSNATIDLIIAPSHMSSTSFSVLPTIGNDHHPVLWHPTFKLSSSHHRHPIKRTHWKLFEVFLTFTAAYWKPLAVSMSHSATFFTLYERFLALCISRFTNITFRKTIKPSLPRQLVNLVNQKRYYLQLFRRTRHPHFAIILRDITKLVHKQLFLYKRKSWLDYCGSFNDCDTKSFWKKAKRHFNSKAAPVEGFLINNNTICSPDDMCAVAKTYYEEQFADHQHTQSEIEIEADDVDNKIERFLMTNPPTPINITYHHLCRSIASLKNKNSTGMDGISNRIIKLLPPNHLTIILVCMNQFAATLQTPSHWHVARMILLSKTKAKVISVEDTRPISLLPCFSKLFEKCFLIYFRQWINEHGILPPEQSGFRPNHNMAVRLVSIIDQIGQSLSKNTAAAALFVDFRSAFNQLWFNGLWLKLVNLQCPFYLLAWLRHYLRGRQAYIDIKNTSSNMFSLSKGVPQGSCIGPVLFIVYHHDILEALSTIHWKHLFADDLAILFSPSSSMSSSNMIHTLTNQVKQVLTRLINYSIKWKQPINFKKTYWTLFNRQVAPQIPTVICEGHTIEHIKKVKYLGTILDAKLSFSAHIDYIKSKIRTNMNVFKRLVSSRMMSEEVNYRLYNAFIRPYLQSILNIYPILTKNKKNQLEGLNRKIFRKIHNWHDARNIEIENLPKYRTIGKLMTAHWDKLTCTMLATNPGVIEDFLQHKLSIVYLREYLSNSSLAEERKKIFGRGRIPKNMRKLLTEERLSLFDHVLCFH